MISHTKLALINYLINLFATFYTKKKRKYIKIYEFATFCFILTFAFVLYQTKIERNRFIFPLNRINNVEAQKILKLKTNLVNFVIFVKKKKILVNMLQLNKI